MRVHDTENVKIVHFQGVNTRGKTNLIKEMEMSFANVGKKKRYLHFLFYNFFSIILSLFIRPIKWKLENCH